MALLAKNAREKELQDRLAALRAKLEQEVEEEAKAKLEKTLAEEL